MSLQTDGMLNLALTQLWQVTLLILAVGLLVRLFGRRRPYLAYALWLLVVVKCLTPPLWSSPTSPFSWSEIQLTRAGADTAPDANDPLPWGKSRPDILDSNTTIALSARSGAAANEPPVRSANWDQAIAPIAGSGMQPPAFFQNMSLSHALAYAWACGAFALFGLIALQAVQCGVRLHRNRIPSEDNVAQIVKVLSRRLKVRRKVRLLVTRQPFGPCVYGVFWPRLVLPYAVVSKSPPDELERIVAHELLHVRRGDNTIGIFQLATLAIWWFHPLVWWANRRACRERERCCDEAVVASLGCDPGTYAQTLLNVLKQRREVRPALLAAGIRSSDVTSQRMESIMDMRRRFHRRTPRTSWALFLVGLLMVVPGKTLTSAEEDTKAASQGTADSPEATAAPPQTPITKYECRLVDAVSNRPVAGASVTVQRRVSGGGKSFREWPMLRETDCTTGADGQYTLDIRPKEAEERHLYIEIRTKHPNHVDYYGGYSYSMIKKNLAMGSQPFFKTLHVWPAITLTGIVVTPTGEPATGVAVFGFSKFDPEMSQPRGFSMEAKTNDQGVFELNAIRGGKSVVWLSPKGYCPSTHIVERRLSEFGQTALRFLKLDELVPEGATKTRDLGRLVLKEGIEIRGRVVDVGGNPMEGIWVNASLHEGPAKKEIGMNLADHIDRSALTDADGRYRMGPLPPSTYRVTPWDEPQERGIEDRVLRPVPGEFFPKKVTLEESVSAVTIDFQAVPHVTLVAQYVRSSGEPRSGSDVHLSGRRGGEFYWKRCHPDANGRIEFTAPIGLENASLGLITNEHSALRHRITKGGPLMNDQRIQLGTITGDMKEIEIIRYVAPILLTRVVDEEGKMIRDPWVTLKYAPSQMSRGEYIRGDRPAGHVSLNEHGDGRWRTSQLFPDEEFTLAVEAPGYESESQKLSLPEGETREIEVKLKKSPEK